MKVVKFFTVSLEAHPVFPIITGLERVYYGEWFLKRFEKNCEMCYGLIAISGRLTETRFDRIRPWYLHCFFFFLSTRINHSVRRWFWNILQRKTSEQCCKMKITKNYQKCSVEKWQMLRMCPNTWALSVLWWILSKFILQIVNSAHNSHTCAESENRSLYLLLKALKLCMLTGPPLHVNYWSNCILRLQCLLLQMKRVVQIKIYILIWIWEQN